MAIIRISKIIKNLKIFSRDDSKDPFEIVSLHELINDSVFFTQNRLDSNGVNLIIDSPKDFFIRAQKVSLSQVFINLIHNASDAIESLEEKWIKVECRYIDDQKILRLKFIDSGTSLSSELAEKIMTPFFTTKEAGKGTGLGLPVCVGIISDHKGQLYFEQKSKNTTFVIDFPSQVLVSQ